MHRLRLSDSGSVQVTQAGSDESGLPAIIIIFIGSLQNVKNFIVMQYFN